MTDKPLPPGWHPMHELPAPGKSRIYLFDVPGEGHRKGEAQTMTVAVDMPGGGLTVETLTPIAWRYR